MKAKYVITEGELDKAILEKILPVKLLQGVKVIAGGGFSSALSWATSLLSTTDENIVLVVDSDSTDDMTTQERYSFLNLMLRRSGTPDRFHIMVLVPEIETIFFQNKDVAESLVGRKLSEIELKLAANSPKHALRLLLNIEPQGTLDILDKLAPEAWTKLRSTSVIKELMDQIQHSGTSKNGLQAA